MDDGDFNGVHAGQAIIDRNQQPDRYELKEVVIDASKKYHIGVFRQAIQNDIPRHRGRITFNLLYYGLSLWLVGNQFTSTEEHTSTIDNYISTYAYFSWISNPSPTGNCPYICIS